MATSIGDKPWRFNAADYLEFPEDAVTGKADHRHRRLLRALPLGPAGRYATENTRERPFQPSRDRRSRVLTTRISS
jgi:hypothetical protein